MVWMCTVVASQIYYIQDAVAAGIDILDIAVIIPCTCTGLLALGKSLPLFMNQDTLKSVLDKLKEIHPNTDIVDNDDVNDEHNYNYSEHPNKEERKIVEDTNKLTYIISVCLGATIAIAEICFFSLPIVLMLLRYCSTGEIVYKTPFLTKYFFDLDTVPKWIIVYAHHAWSSIAVIANIYSSDMLVIILCTCLKMHFELIGKRFEAVICRTSPEKIRRNIKILVIRHQELLRLVEQMDVLFSKGILVQFVITSVMICLSMFVASFTKSTVDFVNFMVFLLFSFTEILLLCYFGDMLITSSTDFGTSVYKSSWYEVGPAIVKDVLFIIQRSQKPCMLSAMGYADLKLMTFTSILSSSWSYFTLLKTMYD